MSVEYVSQDEIEAHEAAMQRAVKQSISKKNAIDKKKKEDIKGWNAWLNATIKRAAAAQGQVVVRGKRRMSAKAAKENADAAVKAAEDEAERKKNVLEEKILAMRKDFERLPLLRQVYQEAPDDVFELIVSKCSGNWVSGGLNALRLVNKRFKQVVESCTTKLENQHGYGAATLPIPIIQKCRRIEEIICDSHNLNSLEGCPDGLKRLIIGYGLNLTDLSPLASCSMIMSLEIWNSYVTDISVVALMPYLEVFQCSKYYSRRPSIKDLSPLASCPRLKHLDLRGNRELKDLSPISNAVLIEHLNTGRCPLINSLDPLSNLNNLKELTCKGIDPQTSLLPLVSCAGLKRLWCDKDAVDLEELRRKRPDLIVNPLPFLDAMTREGFEI